MNILRHIQSAITEVAREPADAAVLAGTVRLCTDTRFGDYMINAQALAHRLNVSPRELALEVAGRLDLGALAGPPEVAGPGFLNIRLRDSWLAATLGELLQDQTLGLEATACPWTVVIDYSSPNVAKPMHVGHVRSTIIGDSLARILTTLGHRVVRDNHLGDWGLQIGMIIWGWKNHLDHENYEQDPVGELARLYRLANDLIKPADRFEEELKRASALRDRGHAAEADAHIARVCQHGLEEAVASGRAVRAAAQAEIARLHEGEPEARELWGRFMPHCLRALSSVYARLGVRFDVQLGESFYGPMLPGVVGELARLGLAVPSEGATVAFVAGSQTPLILRKRDGAFTYATTDLATIRYRAETWHPDLCLYVVDTRQGDDHLQKVFNIARGWGYGAIRLEHVAFGTIMREVQEIVDGKTRIRKVPFKTRDGDAVGLESLLDEAVARARRLVDQKSPHLDSTERERVAEAVGLGAINFADLVQDRWNDYVFDWDRMLSWKGRTAAYVQYAYARIRGISREGDIDAVWLRGQRPDVMLGDPAERALGLHLLRLPEAVTRAADELEPHHIAEYLFELASLFASFYDRCPVLQAQSERERVGRLALCDLVARTVAFGLGLLGIDVVERM